MPAARFQVRSMTPAIIAIVAVLFAACAAPAATTAPTTGALPTPIATVAPTTSAAAPTASAAPLVTLPPVTMSPVTAPPITEPPITPAPTAAVPAIGVKLLIGDQQYMTVTDSERWAGTSTVKPRSGKAFFTVLIQINAIKLTSFDSADFKLKDAAGHSYVWRPGRAPHLYSANNMTAGGTYTGWITYEIPKTSLVGLTLIYKPHFLTGVTFKIPVS